MLMFSDHIVGRQMCAARKSGFFCLLSNLIFCLTGMDNFLLNIASDSRMFGDFSTLAFLDLVKGHLVSIQTITAISLSFIVIVAGVQENGNTQLTSCLYLSCFTPMLKPVKVL